MAQDFYIRTQALLEEFQKRELHFQNTDSKLRNNMTYKKELDMPLQEYMKNINQREKETEETYRSIMKQMDELDRQTDSMMLKIEKMEFLKNSLTNLSVPCWKSDVINQQISSTPQTCISNIGSSRLESVEYNFIPSVERNLKSASTQTEGFFCEECGCHIQNQPNHMAKNVLNYSSSILPGINDKRQDATDVQNSSYSFHECQNNSNFIASTVNSNLASIPVDIDKSKDSQFIVPSVSNFSSMPVNVDKSFARENFTDEQVNKNSYSQILSNNSIVINPSNEENLSRKVGECDNSVESNKNEEAVSKSLKKKHNSPENKAEFNSVKEIETKNDVTESEKKEIEAQNSENELCESKSDAEINIDTGVLKSDAESMNNEFDFLETDTKIKSSETNDQGNSKDYKLLSSEVISNPEIAPSLLVKHPEKIYTKQENVKSTFNVNSKLDFDDERSETSGNVSSPHSPNLSLASDSDSFYKKESPLKASAAYQALLGNTVIPKTIKKDTSESESEDEVESALATVVQKSNIRPKSVVQPKKDKPVPQVVEPKPAVKKSQPLSGNKPQSKLSKSTRKVLGLDTSSGSEVELTLKPPEKKIDDDSDEFFYG